MQTEHGEKSIQPTDKYLLTFYSPLPTQQSGQAQKGNSESEPTATLFANDVTCTNVSIDSLKKIDSPIASSDAKLGKTPKTKKRRAWGKQWRRQIYSEKKNEPVTETLSITLSLPSLDNLPALESIETTLNHKSSKKKRNLVGTCLSKVQLLLSKQQ